MTTPSTQELQTKIFIGFALGPELRIQLNQSQPWKESRILVGQDTSEPIEVRFNNKAYLGYQIDSSVCPWALLLEKQQLLRQALVKYCPHLNPDTHKVYLFSQHFVA